MSIKVTVKPSGEVTVEGPKEFVDNIDWERVQATAVSLMLACMKRSDAIEEAVHLQYAAWKGGMTLREALREVSD